MSDTRIPPSPKPPVQEPRILSSTETAVKLLTVPTEVKAQLKAERIIIRLHGEVVRQNDDGSIRVRTQSGDVDVRLREGQKPPQQGQRVELDIQPPRTEGQPPDTANLRELVRQTGRQDAPLPPRSSDTPVDVRVREGQPAPEVRPPLPPEVRHAQQAVQAAQNQLPPEGAVVRLQPLPTRSAEALPLPEFTEAIVTTLPALVAFKAAIIIQNVLEQIGQAVIDVPLPVPSPVPQVLNAQIPAVAEGASPSTAQPAALPAVLVAHLQAPPVVAASTPVGAAEHAQLPPAITNRSAFISAPVPQPGEPAPQGVAALSIPQTPLRPALSILQSVRQNILNPIQQQAAHLIAPKALPLDVAIEKISPPGVNVLAPQEAGQSLNQIIKNHIEAIKNKPENLIVQNQKAASLIGVVTNVTADKLPVITVFFPQIGGEQSFALQFPSENITIGTQIQVSPQGSAASTAVNTLPQVMPLPIYIQPQPWPAMEEVLQALARAAPQTAQAMVNVTPSPANPAQLGPAMMFFIAAVRGGDLTQWLGKNATDALRIERGGSSLNRLLGEAPSLTRIAAEQMPQDWRALNMPLYWDGDMHKIAVYYKQEHEDSDDPPSGLKSTRFVFDLALDHMGKVQLDGLFRPISEGGTRLDVVVRTEEHFSQATQAEMRRVYAKALRHTQITGELSFQNQPESWVTIQANTQNQLGVSA